MGSGCTSGHGICGLPRLSLRSLVAVGSFMFSGALTAFLTRNTALSQYIVADLIKEASDGTCPMNVVVPSAVAIAGSALLTSLYYSKASISGKKSTLLEHIVSYASGLVFGLGLGISGMCSPDRVINFLNFTSDANGWDPSLMAVMGGGVLFNLISFYWMSLKSHTPLIKDDTHHLSKIIKVGAHPENLKIDYKLVVGSLLFGVGWGLGGICPGPSLVALGGCTSNAKWFVPAMVGGIILQDLVFSSSSTCEKVKK